MSYGFKCCQIFYMAVTAATILYISCPYHGGKYEENGGLALHF